MAGESRGLGLNLVGYPEELKEAGLTRSNESARFLRVLWVPAVVLLALPASVQAKALDGMDLLHDIAACDNADRGTSSEQMSNTISCVRLNAFMEGLMQGYGVGIETAAVRVRQDGRSLRSFCAPDEATIGQGERIAKKYLNAHPEKLHEGGGVLIIEALTEAFPCSK